MERAGQALGNWLGEKFEWSQDDREIAAFSLTLILSSAFLLGLVTVLSLTFGVLVEAYVMALSSGVLRMFAGGAHLSTGWRCGTFSAVTVTLVAVAAQAVAPAVAAVPAPVIAGITAVVALAVAFAMSKVAPVDVPEKPVTSELQRRRLRRMAIAVPVVWGCGWLIWLSIGGDGATLAGAGIHAVWLTSTAGLLWETFSVVPPGMRFARSLDDLIGRITPVK